MSTLRKSAYGLVAVVLAALLSLSLVPNAQAVDGIPVAFPLGSQQIYISQGYGGANNNAYTRWYTAQMNANGSADLVPVSSDMTIDTQMINAHGYSERDMMIYGIGLSNSAATTGAGTRELVRVGLSADGTQIVTQNLGVVAGLPTPNDSYNAGTMVPTGDSCGLATADDCRAILIVKASNSAGSQNVSSLYMINVDTVSVVKTIHLSTAMPNVSDIFWKDGFIWAVHGDPTNAQGNKIASRVYRIDPATGQVSVYTPRLDINYESYGAQYLYGNGNFGILGNTTGTMYQIHIDDPRGNPTFSVVSYRSTGLSTTKNDGTAYRGVATDLKLEKTTNKTFKPGDPVTYTITVTNLGPTDFSDSSGWVLTDILPAVPSPSTITGLPEGCVINDVTLNCWGGALPHGQSATISFTYPGSATTGITDDVVNTATVLGNEYDPDLSNNTSTATTFPLAIDIVKTSSIGNIIAVNDPITYSFTVTNSGGMTLDDVSVSDPFLEGLSISVTCPKTTLIANESMVCTAAYAATSDDIAAGQIMNTATASSTWTDPDDPGMEPITVTSPESTVIIMVGALSINKIADVHIVKAAGDIVNYSFVVTNLGGVPLHDITIIDTMLTGSGVPIVCPSTTLPDASEAPNNAMTCTARYTVTSADIAAGQIVNVATATGIDPDGDSVPAPQSSEIVNVAGLTITKDANKTTVSADGEQVIYTFQIRNTGRVKLTNVAVNDPMLTGALVPIKCPLTTLIAGATMTCAATYIVTEDDIAAGEIHNVATAGGTDPDDNPVTTPESSVSVDVASLVLKKTSDDEVVSAAGEEVTYNFEIANTGNTDLTDVSVDDPMVQAAGAVVICPQTTLVVGESMTCHATYVVNDADITNKEIVNIATAQGTFPEGEVVSPPSTVTINVNKPEPRETSIAVVKSADKTVVGAVDDEILYTFAVTNTGKTTLSNITINDPMLDAAGVVVTCPPSDLASGASVECVAPYRVTAADLASGKIVNVATASGVDPDGEDVTSPESTVTVGVVELGFVKSADRESVEKAGDQILYSFQVTNTGTVDVSDITVVDPMLAAAGVDISCPSTQLAPAAKMTCTATYTVTDADIAAGQIENLASATGKDPDDGDVSTDPDMVTVDVARMSIVKTVTPETVIHAGDKVEYSFIVTNNSDVFISEIAVKDPMLIEAGVEINCPATTLVAGASMSCTATYTVTSEEITAGVPIVNVATSEGIDPDGNPVVTLEDTATVEVLTASLKVVKTADRDVVTKAGDVILYNFDVENTSDVIVTDIVINDPMLDAAGAAISCPVTSLDAHATMTCTASYTVTQADINAGKVRNVATATAKDPAGTPVETPETSVEIPAAPVISLTLVKSTTAKTAKLGDMITYTFTITNTGTVSMTNLTITETKFTGTGKVLDMSGLTCATTNAAVPSVALNSVTLEPNQTIMCTLPAYQVVSGDVATGRVTNTAVAEGTPVGTDGLPTVSNPSTTETGIIRVHLVATGGTTPPATHSGLLALILMSSGLVALLTTRIRKKA
ncbi:MAG: DUF11 domain-containing protein [Propionibacteriaceae bacterium]|jgi:uncharacterized repeat protein (TIGR01451 family)|nr:DUF11 domain-containing protein [Propionibacteriaceae bacterium]